VNDEVRDSSAESCSERRGLNLSPVRGESGGRGSHARRTANCHRAAYPLPEARWRMQPITKRHALGAALALTARYAASQVRIHDKR